MARENSRSTLIRTEGRGQTTIDFAIGVGVFMVVIVFVIGFIPGMLQPFVGGQNRPLVADRAATQLSENLLASPENPYVLNATCTEAFFEQMQSDTAAPNTCRFDSSSGTLSTVLGMGSSVRMNVTIEDESGILDINGRSLAAGSEVPTRTGSVVVAERAVLIEGRTARLYVRVW